MPVLLGGLLALIGALTLGPGWSAVSGGPAGATVPDSQAVLSPLAVSVLAPPEPVVGADGKEHLAYELILENHSAGTVTVTSLGVTNGSGKVLDEISGDALATITRLDTGQQAPAPVLGPGMGAYLFMDVTTPKGQVPAKLLHRFSLSFQAPTTGSAPATAPQEIKFTGVPVTVDNVKPVVISSPLRGPGWIAANGCCNAITSHRGATLAINGTVYAPERFAIDFVELNSQGKLFTGNQTQNSSYEYFGVPVHSVAPGKVVTVVDTEQENTPGTGPSDATVANAGGNYVVVDIGGGHYAFYAHLQPGSIKVRQGQRVKTGQVLGLLGNTGNSDAPHLHFHIMSGPSPLQSNGLPFEITSFVGQGRAGSWSKSQRWMIDVLRPIVPWRSRRVGDVPLVHDEW